MVMNTHKLRFNTYIYLHIIYTINFFFISESHLIVIYSITSVDSDQVLGDGWFLQATVHTGGH